MTKPSESLLNSFIQPSCLFSQGLLCSIISNFYSLMTPAFLHSQVIYFLRTCFLSWFLAAQCSDSFKGKLVGSLPCIFSVGSLPCIFSVGSLPCIFSVGSS